MDKITNLIKDLNSKFLAISYLSLITKREYFILAVFFQLFLVFSLLINYWLVLVSGKEVLLKIEARDPKDLFRGHYLEYRLDGLSSIKIINKSSTFFPREIVYVPLKKDGKYWKVDGLPVKEKPQTTNKLYIRGIVRYQYQDELKIDYGIERFYIPEKYAQKIESAIRGNEIEAAVMAVIESTGYVVLKDLIIDGKSWEGYIK